MRMRYIDGRQLLQKRQRLHTVLVRQQRNQSCIVVDSLNRGFSYDRQNVFSLAFGRWWSYAVWSCVAWTHTLSLTLDIRCIRGIAIPVRVVDNLRLELHFDFGLDVLETLGQLRFGHLYIFRCTQRLFLFQIDGARSDGKVTWLRYRHLHRRHSAARASRTTVIVVDQIVQYVIQSIHIDRLLHNILFKLAGALKAVHQIEIIFHLERCLTFGRRISFEELRCECIEVEFLHGGHLRFDVVLGTAATRCRHRR